MKEKLEKILKQDDRNLSWFWRKYITANICSYAYFMNMLEGVRVKMRDDVRFIITDFIGKQEK